MSNLRLHNLYHEAEREQACQEIYRVMKPGAAAITSDFRYTGEYRKVFKKPGMQVSREGAYFLGYFSPADHYRRHQEG